VLEDLRGVRTAVDVVAEMAHRRTLRPRRGDVLGNQAFDLFQQIQAAVNVTDRVDRRRPFRLRTRVAQHVDHVVKA
jgi:hypothetical protein